MANIGIEVVLGMPFLALSKVKINFTEQELNWKTYNLEDALPITNRMWMIDWREFAAAALALNKEVFIMHMAYLRVNMLIYLA